MNLIKEITLRIKNSSEDQIKGIISDKKNPVTLTYVSKFKNKPVTIPIWIYNWENRFYIFGGKKSKKVQSIEFGNTDVSLLIINREFYPHPEPGSIPYIGISGVARIVNYKEKENLPLIHQKLLLKYDKKLEHTWIKDLYEKVEKNSNDVWLIEINPISFYSYF